MPIFEYVCDDCGSQFEKLVRNGSSVECPSCGQSHLTQQLSTFAARAGESSSSESMEFGGGCPSGMCQTPDLCGRN